MAARIGLISDTHNLLRTEVMEALSGVEAILHAGDISSEATLDQLRKIAPVYAVRGNADKEWAGDLANYLDFELCGLHIYMTHKKKDLPAVGEYWNTDLGRLLYYLDEVDGTMSLFDVALHYNFFNASQAGGNYDLRQIFDNTLIKERPDHAVTFVDNHDTQIGQSLQSFVADWFKPIAYAMILLRQDGIPCVFYSDYYGNPVMDRPLVPNLGKMIKIRRGYAYGEQEDYFDDPHIVGFVRRGTADHPDSGLAVVFSNTDDGQKRMYMGKECAGIVYRDALGCCLDPVVIDEEGFGTFSTKGQNVSIYVREVGFEYLVVTE